MGIDSLTAHQSNPYTHLFNALTTVRISLLAKRCSFETFRLGPKVDRRFRQKRRDIVSEFLSQTVHGETIHLFVFRVELQEDKI